MSSTWLSILTAFEPEYRKLAEEMSLGPNIRCEIHKKGRSTILKIVEIWSNHDHVYQTTERSDRFDDHVYWTQEQLSNWKDVSRSSWDQWIFKNKKDAEKFIILFNLKWAK